MSTTTNRPRVILGLMTFGPPGSEAQGARITSLDTYQQCLDYLQAQGYNELDTARMYISGAQEAFTAQAGYKDRGFKLATKVYPYEAGVHEPARLREHFEKCLKELGTDSVDIFYLHAPDRSVPFEETLKTCNEFYEEGKFKQLGLSNYAAWEVAEMVNIARERNWVQPTIYQAMYNAITRAIEAELIPCCRKYGIEVVVYNPLAGGIFSGKYSISSMEESPDTGRFSTVNDRQGKMYRDRYFRKSTFDALSIVEPVVKAHDLTLVETALRWCVHHSALKLGKSRGEKGAESQKQKQNDGIIIGVSSFEQLKTNLKDLEKGPLPDEVVQALDKAWEAGRGDTPLYWR